MWEDYSKQIGKTTKDLTQAEKIQAEYNGIMQETQHQVGDAQKLMLELAGTQAKYAKTNAELNKSFGEALAPTLKLILDILIPITEGLATFVKNNQELVAIVTIATTTLIGLITVLAGGASTIRMINSVLATFNITLGTLALNPATLAIIALATATTGVAMEIAKAKKATEDYKKAKDELNRSIKDGIKLSELDSKKEELETLKQYQKQLEEVYALADKNRQSDINKGHNPMGIDQYTLFAAQELKVNLYEIRNSLKAYGITIDPVKRQIEELTQANKGLSNAIDDTKKQQEIANRMTAEDTEEKLKNIAATRRSILVAEDLVNTYKTAEKGTKDWIEAEKQLAELYPQYATLSGLKIDAIESSLNAQRNANKAEFDLIKESIQHQKDLAEAALESARIQITASRYVLLSSTAGDKERDKAIENFKNSLREIQGLQSEIALFDELLNVKSIGDIRGTSPVSKSSSTSVEKTAYDKAIQLYQHKKNLGQLTLQDEINILNDIKAKHVKNADDRMDIEERIYNAKQELRQKEIEAQEKVLEKQLKLIQEQEEKLDKRTNNSLRWINRKKLFDEIDEDEEIQAYQRIIKYHKEYLQKIESDEKVSQQEKERIREQEIDFIEDQEDKIFSIKKSYIKKSIEEYMSAKQKELEADERAENERLNKKLSAIDKEYEDKEAIEKQKKLTDELTKLRAEEIKYSNAQTKEGQEKLKSIRDDISKITEDMESDRLEKEKALRKEAIEKEIEDNKTKYQKLKDDLEQSKNDMLSKASEYAKDIQTESTKATNTLVDAISNIFKKWESQNDIFMNNSLNKLQSFINQYKSKMQELQISSIGGNQGLFNNVGRLVGAGTNIMLNVNDNGDKIINSKDEVIDYTQELFNTAKNGLRSIGGGF